MSEKSVTKRDVEDTNEVEDVVDDWLTMEEVAEHKGVKPSAANYEQKCLACVKGLPERNHEDPNLADLGVKQYKFYGSKTKKQVVKQRRLELNEQVGDVNEEDFSGMRNAMASGSGQKMITGGSKQSKAENGTGPGQEVAPPDLEVEVDWQLLYKQQFKKVKQQVAMVGSEVHGLDVVTQSIEGLPADNDMKPVAVRKLAALKLEMEAKKTEYLSKQMQFPKEVPANEVEAKTQELQSLAQELQKSLQQWRKEMAFYKRMVD